MTLSAQIHTEPKTSSALMPISVSAGSDRALISQP